MNTSFLDFIIHNQFTPRIASKTQKKNQPISKQHDFLTHLEKSTSYFESQVMRQPPEPEQTEWSLHQQRKIAQLEARIANLNVSISEHDAENHTLLEETLALQHSYRASEKLKHDFEIDKLRWQSKQQRLEEAVRENDLLMRQLKPIVRKISKHTLD